MRILGYLAWLIMFVATLPLLLLGVLTAWASNLLVGGVERADKAASNNLGEAYTRPRNALGKLLVGAVILAVVGWLFWMVATSFSGSDCDYGRTGMQCYSG